MKKNGKWLLLILSVWFFGDNLKILLSEFAESYVFLPYYLFMALICVTAAYYLARDLELFTHRPAVQPTEIEPAPKKTEPGEELTELDWFIIYNRDLLDKHLASRGSSIVLKNGFNLPPGNFSLVCKKDSGGNYEAKIFPRGCEAAVPYDENNTEHRILYRHLRQMLRNYIGPSDVSDDPEGLKKNVVPIKRH